MKKSGFIIDRVLFQNVQAQIHVNALEIPIFKSPRGSTLNS